MEYFHISSERDERITPAEDIPPRFEECECIPL